jgi:hypothetical protein
VPQIGRLRKIPQKVQKLAAHRSLASGDVGRIGLALTPKCAQGLCFGPGRASGRPNEARPKLAWRLETVQPAGLLGKRAFPFDREIEMGVIETLAEIACSRDNETRSSSGKSRRDDMAQ